MLRRPAAPSILSLRHRSGSFDAQIGKARARVRRSHHPPVPRHLPEGPSTAVCRARCRLASWYLALKAHLLEELHLILEPDSCLGLDRLKSRRSTQGGKGRIPLEPDPPAGVVPGANEALQLGERSIGSSKQCQGPGALQFICTSRGDTMSPMIKEF